MTALHDDFYDVLGVSRTATDKEIRAAYRKLAKQYHPDMNPGDKAKEERFKKITQAYDILGDKEKRARYDRGEIGPDGSERAPFGHGDTGAGFGGAGFEGFEDIFRRSAGRQGGFRQEGPFTFRWSSTRSSGPGAGAHGGGRHGVEPEDISDIFADLFGGGGRTGFRAEDFAAQGPAAGADVRYRVTVSLEEAALGVRKRLRLQDGKTVDLTIPAGLEDGQVLRLKGEGRRGAGGGPAGDALVEVRVAPHPIYTREGLNIRMEFPVTLQEAVLGGKVTVPTLHGPVSVTIPKGATSGQTLRLRGKGIHKGGQKGDQYVRLMVALPEKPDPKLDAFVRRWAKEHPYTPKGR